MLERIRIIGSADKLSAFELFKPLAPTRRYRENHSFALKLDLQFDTADAEDGEPSLRHLFEQTQAALEEANRSGLDLDTLFEGFMCWYNQSQRRK